MYRFTKLSPLKRHVGVNPSIQIDKSRETTSLKSLQIIYNYGTLY